MSESIGLELEFFLVSVTWGVILLIVYDGLRIFRRMIPHSKEFVAIEDILFWIVSGVLIFDMMFEQNSGIIRGFSILGMTIGMVLYNHFISAHLVKGTSTFLLKLFGIIAKIIGLMLGPWRWINNRVKWILLFLSKKIVKLYKIFLKRLKKTYRTVKITVTKK